MNSTISNKWIIRHLCISLIICCGYGSTTSASDSKCSRPESMSPTIPLYIYHEPFTRNVTVYHCLFKEKKVCIGDLCVNCKGVGSVYGPNITINSTQQHSDITIKCLSAFDTNRFVFYPRPYKNYTEYLYQYKCDNNVSLKKIITITFTKYDATADIAQDKLTLESGTICKYSSGFCHDIAESIDVLWNLDSYPFSCNSLRRADLSQSYHVHLNGKNYVVIESHHKYFSFDWSSVQLMCGVRTWEIQKEKLIVTSEPIVEARNHPLDDVAYWHSFWNKQNLYDFLTGKCLADLNNSSTDALFEKLKLKDEQEYLKKLESDHERSLSKRFTRDYLTVEERHGDETSWKLNCVFCILVIVVGFQIVLLVAFISTFLLKFLQQYFPKKKSRKSNTPRADFELKPTNVQSQLYESVNE